MGIICTIGGGEIGRFKNGKQQAIETKLIDQELITLTGKTSPKVLFIPTASRDDEGYIQTFSNYYQSLGAEVETLLLYKKFIDIAYLKKQIFAADIIYVGGGNTLNMIKLWRKVGLISLLKQAYDKGIILSGLSAGSICWYYGGMSDSIKSSNKDADYIIVKGLDLIPFYHCPHFDSELERKKALAGFVKKTHKNWIVLDDGAALLKKNNRYKIISSKANAKAHLFYKEKGEIKSKILDTTGYQKLSELL